MVRELTKLERQMLIISVFTRTNAYAAKTEHKIGAAVLTEAGNVYGGCNIESNISGLGCCAERVAVAHAIAHGEYRFRKLMVLDKEHIIPCGACLQYLAEFSAINEKDIQILSSTPEGDTAVYSLRKLLPLAYYSKNKEKVEAYRAPR